MVISVATILVFLDTVLDTAGVSMGITSEGSAVPDAMVIKR